MDPQSIKINGWTEEQEGGGEEEGDGKTNIPNENQSPSQLQSLKSSEIEKKRMDPNYQRFLKVEHPNAVEPNWRSRLTFKLIGDTEDEVEEVCDFVNDHFMPHEPLNDAIDLCPPGYRATWFDNLVKGFTREKMTIIARDPLRSNIIVGVAICTQHQKGETDKEESLKRWAECPAKFQEILKLLNKIVGSVDFYDMYKVQEYLELFILSSDMNVRYPGLGSELLLRIEDFARESGFRLFVSDASSFFSLKIFKKFDWSCLGEIKYSEYCHEVDGERRPVFNVKPPHEAVVLVAKELK